MIIANLVAILFLFQHFGILIVVIANIIFIPLPIYFKLKLNTISKDTINSTNCQFCGKTINPDEKFCFNSGKAVENSSNNS